MMHRVNSIALIQGGYANEYCRNCISKISHLHGTKRGGYSIAKTPAIHSEISELEDTNDHNFSPFSIICFFRTVLYFIFFLITGLQWEFVYPYINVKN